MLDLRDLAVPVVCAPMAGGPSTPALVSAACDAGALGFLAAGYRTPEHVAAEVDAVRAATSAPWGLNLFVVEPYEARPDVVEEYRRAVEPEATRLGVTLGEPRWDDDHLDAKLELALDLRPAVVSFTFGCPRAEVFRDLAGARVLAMVTVTTVDEARAAVARGAAALSVQGPGAGGHRGTWDPEAAPGERSLGDLLAAVRSAVDVPLVAGGGVGRARDVAAIVAGGALAAQVGTGYLLADEAGTNPVHRAALSSGSSGTTALTRAYTGRWARGLANRFIDEHVDAPAGYPQVHHLTRPLRSAAVVAGDAEVAQMWAGTGHSEVRAASAAEITGSLVP